jgi:hypothetical protein
MGSSFKINGVNISSGTLTSFTSANTDIVMVTWRTALILTLNAGVTGGASDSNKIEKLNASGLIPAAMFRKLIFVH